MVDLGYAHTVLEKHFGFTSFREGQDDVIKAVLERRDCLVVMPTGGGKSLCFQLPALMLDGVTLVISPLIALMKDQVESLQQRGISATFVNSSLPFEEQKERLRGIRQGKFQLIYAAPERFRSEWFRDALRDLRIALFAIDEAHCVSQWGHDFRPDYLRLRAIAESIGRPQMIALTATATPYVRADIIEQLGLKTPQHFVAGFARPNLQLRVVHTTTEAEKLAQLRSAIARANGSGIVFGATRKSVETLAARLAGLGLKAAAYHAGMDVPSRSQVQEDFMSGRIDTIVATNAFGMGVDKPDIRLVAHYQMPSSIESYYQEIGRAGRDGQLSECLLFFNYADKRTQDYFIDGSYPQPDVIEAVYRALASCQLENIELSVSELAERSGVRNEMAVRSALVTLEHARHLERGNSADNLATMTPKQDLVAFLEQQARETQTTIAVRALLAEYDLTVGTPTQVNLNKLSDIVELNRSQLTAAMNRLAEAGVVEYLSSFKGRGIHLLDNPPARTLRINRQELARRAANEQLKLRKVIDFAYHKACLSGYILKYFQDARHHENCGLCSNCRPGTPKKESSASVATASALPTKAPAGTLTIKRQGKSSELNRFIIQNAPAGEALRAELDERSAQRKAVAAPQAARAGRSLTDEDCLTVRKILSCVARLNGRFGKTMVASVLHGSKSKKVLNAGLDQLSTYGLLNFMSLPQISEWIEALVAGRLIEVAPGLYPTVALTEAGREVMKGTAPPSITPPKF